jgi:hypothetical protein
MSDIPSPDSTPKPKLTLSPKAPAAEASAPASAAPAAATPPPLSPPSISSAGASNSTPPSIAAASKSGGLKPNFKLQGAHHPSTPTDAPAFQSPMPAKSDDKPSAALFALSFIAAAAALAFAYLLYVKNQ